MEHKKYLIILLTLFTLLSCDFSNKDKECEIQVTSLFDDLSKQIQIYKIPTDTTSEIIGNGGTLLEFSSNIFELTEGDEVIDSVEIQLAEYYNLSDMLFGNLTTNTTNDKLLETRGMVHIQAFSNQKKLKLKKGKSFKISFPIQDSLKQPEIKLFSGKVNPDGSVVWNDKSIEQFDNTNSDFDRYLLRDDVMTEEELDYIERKLQKSLDYYVFNSTSLLWLNCDKNMNIEEGNELLVSVDKELKPVVRLIFHDNKSIMIGRDKSESQKEFYNLPSNGKVTVFAFSKVDNKIYLAQKDLTVSSSIRNIDLNFRESTIEKLKEAAENLEWGEENAFTYDR